MDKKARKFAEERNCKMQNERKYVLLASQLGDLVGRGIIMRRLQHVFSLLRALNTN